MPTCPTCRSQLNKRKAGGWSCPECAVAFTDAQLELTQSHHAQADTAFELAHLPFPVAYPLSHALRTDMPVSDRTNNTIFSAYQAMRTCALVLLADFLDSDLNSRVVAGAITGLRMPHWGDWATLCDKLALLFTGKDRDSPEASGRFPALATRWLEVSGRLKSAPPEWGDLLVGLPGLQHGPARSLNDAIWKARNDRAHRQATAVGDDVRETETLSRILPLAQQYAAHLFSRDGFTLLRAVRDLDGLKAFRLHGARIQGDIPSFDIGPVEPLHVSVFQGGDLAAVIPGGAAVALHPLFIAADPETSLHPAGSGGFVEPVILVDGATPKSVVLLGVRSHSYEPSLAAPLLAALSRKQVDFGLKKEEAKWWALPDWAAATSRTTLGELTGRKYFPDCYVERENVDPWAEAVLSMPGRALLVLGEAGSGKSSLLARAVERLLPPAQDSSARGAGDIVVYLSGRLAYAGEAGATAGAVLCDAVCRQAGIRPGVFATLQELAVHLESTARDEAHPDRRLVLILDGLNEAERFTELFTALDAFLPCLQRHPWLRLIVAMRSGAYQALSYRHYDKLLHGASVIANAHVFLSFFDDVAKKDVPYLDVRRFHLEDEGPKAYLARQRALPERSAALGWGLLSPGLRQALLSPLHLHLFHETFKGATAVSSALGENEILDAYLDIITREQPGLGPVLLEVARLCYETRSPEIPIEVADEWLTHWRSRATGAVAMARLDPVEELVSASLLMRMGAESKQRASVLQFTHQKLAERVLYRELRSRIAPRTLPTSAELVEWARHAAGGKDDFAELVGALESFAIACAQKGDASPLMQLLPLGEEEVVLQLVAAAVRSEGLARNGEAAPVLDALVRAAEGNLVAVGALNRAADGADGWLAGQGASLGGLRVCEARVAVLAATPALTQAGNLAAARLDLATFLAAQGRTAEALELGHLALAFAAASNTKPEELHGRALVGVGQLEQSQGNASRAREFFQRSLDIFEVLASREPSRVDLQQSLGICLCDVARLEQSQGNASRAREFFQRSLDICEVLASREPSRVDFQESLGISLAELARLEQREGNSSRVREFFQRSLDIREVLASREPSRADFQESLGISLTGLAHLEQSEGNASRAREFFKRSLDIREVLASREPSHVDFQRDLCICLSELARLEQSEGNASRAREFFKRSLDIREVLASREPSRVDFQKGLSICLTELASLEQSEGNASHVREFFQRSLDIVEALASREPSRVDFQESLGLSLTELARLEQSQGNASRAREFFQRSLDIREVLASREPSRVDLQKCLGISLIDIARLEQSEGNASRAREFFQRSLDINEVLASREPSRVDLQRDLGISLTELARLEQSQGNASRAREFFQRSLDIYEVLASREPSRVDLQQNLCVVINAVGRLEFSGGNFECAQELFMRDLEICRALCAADPLNADLEAGVASTCLDLALSSARGGDMAREKTASHLEEARRIRARRFSKDPKDGPARENLAECLAVAFALSRTAAPSCDRTSAQQDEQPHQYQRLSQEFLEVASTSLPGGQATLRELLRHFAARARGLGRFPVETTILEAIARLEAGDQERSQE